MKKNKHSIFNDIPDEKKSGVIFKNLQLKKKIIRLLDKKGAATINDISKKFNSSSPKVNKLIQELIDEGLIEDLGKAETDVGRRPHLYGLIGDSMYFMGVDLGHNSIEIGLMDFNENPIHFSKDIKFSLENSEKSLLQLCDVINLFIDKNPKWRNKIVRIGVNLSGRVNHLSGYSHNFFNFTKIPLSSILQEKLGIPCFIENDTRARAFYEFYSRETKDSENILYVNADYGLGLGVLAHGKLLYGKSGYSGEFGHIPFFNNEIICICGKKGCLETEVSGRALEQQFKDKLKGGQSSFLQNAFANIENIKMDDIIKAANNDDTLSIELIGAMAEKLGKGITTLIHLYNPELIIFGGALTKSKDHFFLPLQMTVNKYSLSIVRADTQLELSKGTEGTGVFGACYLAKHKVLNPNLS